jgi:hypothetical protein
MNLEVGGFWNSESDQARHCISKHGHLDRISTPKTAHLEGLDDRVG